MARLVGILVRLDISGAAGSGTDDPIYLGVMGPRGGREFPLKRSGKNDWEAGSKARYVVGTVPVDDVPPDAAVATRSKSGERNSPDRSDIDAEAIQTVYLRKREGVSSITDDAVSILRAEAIIYDDNGAAQRWYLDSKLGIWLGTQYGSQVALSK